MDQQRPAPRTESLPIRPKQDPVWERIVETLNEFGLSPHEPCVQSMIMRGGHYSGRRFKFQGLQAIWLADENTIEFYRGRLRLVASPDGREGSLTVKQDVEVFLSTLGENEQVAHEPKPGRYAWLQVLRSAVHLNELELVAGDGVAVSEEPALLVRATEQTEIMLFDLP